RPEAPGMVLGLADADPAGDRHLRDRRAGRDPQPATADQIGLLQIEGDAERLAELARTRAEEAQVGDAAAHAHEIDSYHWLQSANEDGAGFARRFGDNVEHDVDAVGTVDVGD